MLRWEATAGILDRLSSRSLFDFLERIQPGHYNGQMTIEVATTRMEGGVQTTTSLETRYSNYQHIVIDGRAFEMELPA